MPDAGAPLVESRGFVILVKGEKKKQLLLTSALRPQRAFQDAWLSFAACIWDTGRGWQAAIPCLLGMCTVLASVASDRFGEVLLTCDCSLSSVNYAGKHSGHFCARASGRVRVGRTAGEGCTLIRTCSRAMQRDRCI